MRDVEGVCGAAAQSACAAQVGDEIPYLFPSNLLADAGSITGFDCPEQDTSECDLSANWWLVYTKSRQEKMLSRQLTEMQVPHYLPVHKREAITRGRTRVVEEPLFTGYLFLYADHELRRAALTTNRISTTLLVDDARRLRRELWQISVTIASGARLAVEANLQPGDWVRVKSGIYEGLEGCVIRRHNQTRLVLSVDFLKQGASLELHDSLLERIDPPSFDGRLSVEIVRRIDR